MTANRDRDATNRVRQTSTESRHSVARRETEPLTLAEVMQQHPLLTYFGIGVFDPLRKTPEQRRTELAAGREELASNEDNVREVAAWLRANVTPIKTPTQGSYGMKHVVERQLGRYVSNGELIADALIVGYPFRHVEGPNVLLGMSQRDVKRLKSTSR